MLLSGSLRAEGVLQSMRRTDLNDYAFGVAVSAVANPLVGASTSAFAYPYLTAFENPAFTRDWLVIRDGDIGIRRVTDDDWEFGWVTRVQTLGLGGDENEQAAGLLDRRWTLESGPMIGLRRFPVHVGFKLYGELLDRHRGYTAELAFSVPRDFSWGYLVPSVELDYLSDRRAGAELVRECRPRLQRQPVPGA